MLNQDLLGLIADLNYLRPPQSAMPEVVPPQENYVLLPAGQGVCRRCGRRAVVILILGMPNLLICQACDPSATAADFIESTFAEADEESGWVLA